MSRATPTSAEILRKIWARYAEGYKKTSGRDPSMRETSKDIGLDESALSRWMNPGSHRIPVRMIPVLEQALMMSVDELGELMITRLTELNESDDMITVNNWLIEFLKRLTALSQEEELVLATFRSAREKYPLGLHLDAEEQTIMRAQMEVLLERAQENELELRSHDAENLSLLTRAMLEQSLTSLAAAAKLQPSKYKQAKERAMRLCCKK